MKRSLVFLVIALAMLILPVFVQAASMSDESVLGNDRWSVQNDGDFVPGANSSYDIGSSSYQVNDLYVGGVVYFGTSSSSRVNYEVVTATTDTLVATDSGKIMIYTSTNDTTVTLPAATTLGTYFIILSPEGIVSVDPATTDDTIIYDPSGTALSAGDKMTAAATGDSVTLVCGATNKWYVVNRIGSWTDGD